MRIWLLVVLVTWCSCNKPSDPVMMHDPPLTVPARPAVPTVPAVPSADAGALANANNQFAFDLWKAAATPRNFAISPTSIMAALAMTWRGAKGETSAQMAAVLHFDGDAKAIAPRWGRLLRALQDPRRPITLRLANRLFGQDNYPFKPAFVDDLQSAFDAAFEPVGFASNADAVRLHINDWVEQRTEHRIKDLLGPRTLTAETRLVLVNATYFLADWATPFSTAATTDQEFLVGADRKRVKTMHAVATGLHTRSDGVSILEMPYQGNDTAMLVLLPDRADGLADLERTVDATRLATWRAAMTRKEVNVSLPRFTIDTELIPLSDHLARLGMPAAFDKHAADFTDIAAPPDPGERLYLSAAFHKVFVKVDERGTEAAAATAVAMGVTSVPPPPIPFTADHPFLFAIIDTSSGLVLFLGHVVDPG